MNQKKALFAGSFDPFTYGHMDVALQAAPLFDKLYICIANNPDKKRLTSPEIMRDAIKEVFPHLNIEVVIHDGLVAEYCAKNDIRYLVRGLRSTSDYLYEENIAKINHELNPNLHTIYIRGQMDTLSSTLVKELLAHNADVSKYLPPSIYDVCMKIKREA